jgi:hypothetical protein
MVFVVLPLGVTSFLKASLKDLFASFRVVGSWWSSSLYPYPPMFYSQWFLLQQLTLPSSSGSHSGCFAVIVLLADALPPLALASALADALLPSVSWSLPLRMLCYNGCFGGYLAAVVSVGGCFTAVAALGG